MSKATKKKKALAELAKELRTGGGITAERALNSLLEAFGGLDQWSANVKEEWDHSKHGSNMRTTIVRMFASQFIHTTAANRGQVMGEDASDEELEAAAREELDKFGLSLEELDDEEDGEDLEDVEIRPEEEDDEEPPLDEQIGQDDDWDPTDDGVDMDMETGEPRLGDLLGDV